MNNKNIYKDFASQYELLKTLRFELKPIGKTLEKMRENIKYDKDLQTFLKDQEVEDSYQTLKPVFDRLHESFINESLNSKTLKNTDFSEYFEKYKNKKNEDLTPIENKLRSAFSNAYEETANKWKKQEKSLKKQGYEILLNEKILNYIRTTIDSLTEAEKKGEIEKALTLFEKGFFTYLTGFNQNRENYYETKTKKATAVATRTIHENLPKFCDNVIAFEKNKQDYLDIHRVLSKQDIQTKEKKKIQLIPINQELFNLNHFNKCLAQSEIEKYNQEIGNINSLINLYNQKNKKKEEFKKLQSLKTLHKQIGCGKKDSEIFIIERDRINTKKPLASLEEVLQLVNNAGQEVFIQKRTLEIKTVPAFLKYIKEREAFNGIYWSKTALNNISAKYFSNWDFLSQLIQTSRKPKGVPAVIELGSLFEILNKEDKNLIFKESIINNKKEIIENSKDVSDALLNMIFSDIEENIKIFINKAPEVLKKENLRNKELIKKWLDSVLRILQMLKYFSIKEEKIKDGNPLDPTTAEVLKFILDEDFEWFKWYNAIRNYLTKKNQDDLKKNKLKMNFSCNTLAAGWDKNKESSNLCTIFKDEEENLYLGVINKEKCVEIQKLYKTTNKKTWNKMEYNFLPDATKMIPKCSTQVKKVITHFENSNNDFIFPVGYKVSSGKKFEIELIISKEVFALNNKGYQKDLGKTEWLYYIPQARKKDFIKKFQKEYWKISFKQNNPNEKDLKKAWENFCKKDYSKLNEYEKSYKDALTQWIDFCKDFLSKYPKTRSFPYKFKNSKEYNSLDEFYNDVNENSYNIDFNTEISKNELDKLIDNGIIYLFQIKNQDYNKNKKPGFKKNLHTIYWENVFKNIENRPKLNGKAEIFYRPALSPDKLEKTKDKNNKEIIKNFRFSKEKFLFHVSITLNPNRKQTDINKKIKDLLKQSKDVYFLGIDRGENHLAYYSLIDSNSKIIKQGTLNLPFTDKDGKPRTIKAEKRTSEGNVKIVECKDYNDLLDARAENRDFARKNWQTIENIKDLKNGYISKVIHEIINLTITEDKFTFIVLEDLNIGFKRGRQKIEKSVYQNLELALAKKLNFIVDKNATLSELGSTTNAIQLTPLVNNFGDIEKRKQFGNMLYVRADYTSQTDPITGWVKTIYIKKGSEKAIRDRIKKSFSDINFDGKNYIFEYKDSNNKKWKLYSGLDRYYRERNNKGVWISTKQNTTELLNKIFKNIDKTKSIYDQIINQDKKLEKISKHTAWESLRFTIHLIQQIRNQDEDKNDFILSPIRNEQGEHFDSRKAKNNEPNCGDANGAFNIARKGIIVSKHIKKGIKKLYIRDDEWRAWLAGKKTWENWLKKELK